MHPADREYRGFPDFSQWAESKVSTDLWDRSAQALTDQRTMADDAAFATLAERAVRVASIDTGAVEGLYSVDRGFTMTVASMASAWEAEIQAEKGPDVAALVAAQRAGYDMALDAATSLSVITEAWIRRLHEVVCGAQDTYDVRTAAGPQRHMLPKGEYKHAPNHVELADGSVHAYAPVEETQTEMHRLVNELRSPAFAAAHPVHQASYAHFAFVRVHPFADGNGRVARTLASVYFFRAISLPFVFFADQKDAYLTALEAADGSQFQSFVDFVMFCGADLQGVLAEDLSRLSVPSIDASLARLGARAYPAGLSRDRLQTVGRRLLAEVETSLRSVLEGESFPENVEWHVEDFYGEMPPPNGWWDPADVGVRITVSTLGPSPKEHSSHFGIFAAWSDPVSSTFRVHRDGAEFLDVRLGEVYPTVTMAFRRRLSLWLHRSLAELIAALAADSQ